MGKFFRTICLATSMAAMPMLSYPLQAQQQVPNNLQGTAESVIGGQIRAFKSKEHDKAFGYAAPSIRKIFGSTGRFIGMVQSGYGAIYGAKSWTYGRAKAVGETIVQEVLIAGPQGRNWVALYTLSKQEDGSWKISGVQLKQGEALST